MLPAEPGCGPPYCTIPWYHTAVIARTIVAVVLAQQAFKQTQWHSRSKQARPMNYNSTDSQEGFRFFWPSDDHQHSKQPVAEGAQRPALTPLRLHKCNGDLICCPSLQVSSYPGDISIRLRLLSSESALDTLEMILPTGKEELSEQKPLPASSQQWHVPHAHSWLHRRYINEELCTQPSLLSIRMYHLCTFHTYLYICICIYVMYICVYLQTRTRTSN